MGLNSGALLLALGLWVSMCMKGIIIRLDSKVVLKINRIVFVKYLIICEGQNLACGLGVRALEVDRQGAGGPNFCSRGNKLDSQSSGGQR